jgi:hypothetical protein
MAEGMNIVPLEEVGQVVQDTLEQINSGLWKSVQAGILVNVPKEVTFTMTVVKKFEYRELVDVTTGRTTDDSMADETAKSLEKQKSTELGTSTEKATSKDTGKTEQKEVSTGTETQASTGTQSTAQQGTRVNTGNNSHTQNTDETTVTETP